MTSIPTGTASIMHLTHSVATPMVVARTIMEKTKVQIGSATMASGLFRMMTAARMTPKL